MNALVKKEVRLLLPAFSVASALALTNAFMPRHAAGFNLLWYVLPFVSCPLVALMMALGSFGAEVGSGTFSLLLTQPVPRQRMWNIKTVLLALAFVVVGCLWCVAFSLQAAGSGQPFKIADLLVIVGLFAMVVLSGALWTVLLLRQVAAAFWFTLLAPGLISLLPLSVCGERSDKLAIKLLEAVLVLYSVGGFLFARRLFLRAQDVQWSGGNITLPRIRLLANVNWGSGIRRAWRPRVALQVKELQLHQSQFVVAGVLALLHLGVVALRTWGGIRKNSALEFILETFWTLWLVMPLLVGCAAAAEERKLGTLHGELCLPVSRRTQFAIKAGTALGLAALFGAVMPALLELPRLLPAARALFQSAPFEHAQLGFLTAQKIYLGYGFEATRELLALLMFPGIAAGIALVSFYGSTLSRSTLQALSPAVLGLVVVSLLWGLSGQMNFHILGLHFSWQEPLIYLIGVPVLAVMLLVLSSRNCRRLDLGWQTALENAAAIFGTLILIAVVTSATYHRAWERLLPLQPAPGPARLTLANPATISYFGNQFAVHLPDGRIWSADLAPVKTSLFPGLPPSDLRLQGSGTGQFVGGSNWVSWVNDFGDQAGIKTDGTLWVSAQPAQYKARPGGGGNWENAGELVQYGTNTDWRSLAARSRTELLLVKNDGTLWQWGASDRHFKGAQWAGLRALAPERLGTESDWAEVLNPPNDLGLWLRKTDGSIWTTEGNGIPGLGAADRSLGFPIWRATVFERLGWRSLTISAQPVPRFVFGVGSNGMFRVLAREQMEKMAHKNEYRIMWASADLPLGHDTNWLAVAGRGQNVVTLRDDGSLWVWHVARQPWFRFDPQREQQELQQVEPVQLGTHSNWIAIASAEGGIVSLAADGSLWYWLLDSADDLKLAPLLELSRKPQFLGNIFAGTNVAAQSSSQVFPAYLTAAAGKEAL
jgi:hypothetical protein